MRRYMTTTIAAIGAALALAATDSASAAQAAGAVRGTRERITFEGLVHRKKVKSVPNGYDGLNWTEVLAEGKIVARQSPGARAVIQGKVVATSSATDSGSEAKLSAPTEMFSLRSGHFASGVDGTPVSFLAYRNGVLVGSMQTTLDPTDNKIVFDSTFAHVDEVIISTTGSGTGIAMDDLIVKF